MKYSKGSQVLEQKVKFTRDQNSNAVVIPNEISFLRDEAFKSDIFNLNFTKHNFYILNSISKNITTAVGMSMFYPIRKTLMPLNMLNFYVLYIRSRA